MRVAISQSNYLPWKGYFHQIARVDVFVLYDCAQYTRRDWRNRNKIMTPQGPQWITVPVLTKGEFLSPIEQIEVEDHRWVGKHLGAIKANYARAPFFKEVFPLLEREYAALTDVRRLSEVNERLLRFVTQYLAIETKIMRSGDFQLREGKSERLLGICQDLGADCYLSGPAAKDYLDLGLFQDAGIAVEWMSYQYQPYAQLGPAFDHFVSVIDLLMAEGKAARRHLS